MTAQESLRVPGGVQEHVPDEATNKIDEFPIALLFNSKWEEWVDARGAVCFSPFGVTHMLANIHSKVWNVFDDGMEKVLQVPKESISVYYTDLLEKYKKAEISTSNFLFARDETTSVALPEQAQKLQTKLIYTDYWNDWDMSSQLMNALLAENTGGTLDGHLIPLNRLLGAAFYEHTVGGYIGTTHYKGRWLNTWNSVGKRQFSDGESVPFYQVEGPCPVLDDLNFTAVAIPFADKAKYAVFVLPKREFETFFREDLPQLLRGKMNPLQWQMSNDPRKIQIPKINLIILMNHWRSLKDLGMNNTFCLPTEHSDPESGIEAAGGKENYIALRPFFVTPIVQVSHIKFDGEFIEFSSGTATTINSTEKLVNNDDSEQLNDDKETGDNDKVNEDKEEADEEELSGEDPFINDEEANRSNQLSDEEKFDNKEQSISNKEKNDDGQVVSNEVESPESGENPGTALQRTSEEDTLVFDKPFFWYLYDTQAELLQYGSVYSLEKYKLDGIPEPGFEWLQDVAKTIMWNCP